MAPQTVKLRYNHGNFADNLFEVDGVNLTNAVRSASINVAAADWPEVTVDLAVFELDTLIDGARFALGPNTHEALIALGWTPPVEH